jgi:hypothetical protein
MSRTHIALTFGAVALFVSGVGVGQKTGTSKFAKYRQPAYISIMDWKLLQARVESIAAGIPMNDGVGTADFYFDPDTNKVGAVVLVSASELEAEPAGKVRELLKASAEVFQAMARQNLPELGNQDFEIEFKAFGDKSKLGAGKGAYTYAEYTNGQLIMH